MSNETPSISVIIPTLNAEKELPAQLGCLHNQTTQAKEIIVIDSASDDGTERICSKDSSVRYIRIKREDFDHGRTRDIAAGEAKGDYIVFLTQDAIPAHREFLERLTAPLIKGEAAVSTGRQLPKPGATHMEASVRRFNYPEKSNFRSKKDIPKLGIKTFFCSDVCSAYNKEIYLELGGFEYPIRTNEDMLFAAKAIQSGYKVAYVADAMVYHSHNLTLMQQFRRNYIQGYEIERHQALLSGVPLETEGKKMVMHVTKDLLHNRHPLEWVRFGTDCVARLAGSRLGRAAYNKKKDKLFDPDKTDNNASTKHVCVLLATYNGEVYLQEQLDSLYRQNGVDISILARDDGSGDATTSILEDNQKGHDCLRWYQDGHRGSAGSFLKLIEDSPEADYYALCDQDDVWDDDKLKCAVDMFSKIPDDQPALYYSNLRVVDDDLRFHRNAHSKPWVMKSKYSALVDVAATGCTMVFNRALRDMLRAYMPEDCKMHDEWIYLVSRFFGTVVYDFEPHISYRQHGDNVLGMNLTRLSPGWLKQKVERTFEKDWKPRSVNARSLLKAYKDVLGEEDIRKVEKVAGYNESMISKGSLLTDLSIHGKSIKDDLKYRIKIITGTA